MIYILYTHIYYVLVIRGVCCSTSNILLTRISMHTITVICLRAGQYYGSTNPFLPPDRVGGLYKERTRRSSSTGLPQALRSVIVLHSSSYGDFREVDYQKSHPRVLIQWHTPFVLMSSWCCAFWRTCFAFWIPL
jgi:hypothetical protein